MQIVFHDGTSTETCIYIRDMSFIPIMFFGLFFFSFIHLEISVGIKMKQAKNSIVALNEMLMVNVKSKINK